MGSKAKCAVALIIAAITFVTLFGTFHFALHDKPQTDGYANMWQIKISPDTVYVGAATIIGLATFGSVLGLRFSRIHERHGTVEVGTAIILGAIVLLIFVQGNLMFSACCGNLSPDTFAFMLALSITSLIVAIFGFGYIL